MAADDLNRTEPYLDVLIVGGGLVGLGLATALGSAGLHVAVIDRERPATVLEPVFDGRTSAIAQGSRRILEGIGVWPKAAPDAEPILDIRVSEGASLLFIHFDHREVANARGAEPLGHIVENRVIRKALFDRIAELDTVWLLAPMTVTKLVRGPGRIEATLADGRTLAARLAISAEGRNSRLRGEAGIPVSTWTYKTSALVATVAHEHPHSGVAQERFLPPGPFAVLPMTDDALGTHRSSIVWTDRPEVIAHLVALDGEAFNRELAQRFGDYLGETAAFGQRWSYPLSLLHADSYIAERLALVGDAAHAIHPMAGRGARGSSGRRPSPRPRHRPCFGAGTIPELAPLRQCDARRRYRRARPPVFECVSAAPRRPRRGARGRRHDPAAQAVLHEPLDGKYRRAAAPRARRAALGKPLRI
jgi:2-octaprenyl-6-methoxyphenol hydroxylase